MFQGNTKDPGLSQTESLSVPDPEVRPAASRRVFTAEEKLRILDELDQCAEPGEVGALLRREGIYSSYISRWKKQKEEGLLHATIERKRGRRPHTSGQHQKELARLRAENQRLHQRLQKAEAIIEVQKKVSILLGLEETER